MMIWYDKRSIPIRNISEKLLHIPWRFFELEIRASTSHNQSRPLLEQQSQAEAALSRDSN